MSQSDERDGMTRRSFFKATAAGVMAAAATQAARAAEASALKSLLEDLPPAAKLQPGVARTWIGPEFWANRLQDWKLADGRIECAAAHEEGGLRSLALLTRELVPGPGDAAISAECGFLEPGAPGFAGFLIGAGAEGLDWRAAALVQRASGTGGGILCVCDGEGEVSFRDHTDDAKPLEYAPMSFTPVGGRERMATGVPLRLTLRIAPGPEGVFDMTLGAWQDTVLLSSAAMAVPAGKDINGGILLVSSSAPEKGARHWFRDIRTGGKKIAERPERTVGPILGTLYSVNGPVLKMTAQLMPVGDGDARAVTLQCRRDGQEWKDRAAAEIGPGYTALFRVDDWDSARDWEYRVVYPLDPQAPATYAGRIPKDPAGSRPLSIGLFSCTTATAHSLDRGGIHKEMPQAELLGRYTPENVYFPYPELVRHSGSRRPDLLVFAGDQFYEGSPTPRESGPAPTLDYLYKWYLWMWSFRDMTRDTPAILMVDDHDVYHGNLWGNGGRAAPDGDQNRGGYKCGPEFVNMVQRVQCAHNPDPYDPTPVDQDISVYYGAFRYGGVSFCVLEDRKFKTAPLQGSDLDVYEPELLGERQEAFLQEWGRAEKDSPARICLTQTLFACLQTSPAGKPLMDFDSNGYPKYNRDRAVELLRDARALVLAGDQHLASVVRHGLDSYDDGVVQFAGPAGSTSWTRWFEPRQALANAAPEPCTGDFKDAFGNKVRVLAVANPRVTFAEYRKHKKGRGQGLGDRNLKAEGYAVVTVDFEKREYGLECWRWDTDPTAEGAKQFPGWPVRVGFDEVDRAKAGAA